MNSIQTTEEILQAHKDWTYDRTDRNGTRYFSSYRCPKCGGKGVIPYYGYVDGGVCFECGGHGVTDKAEIFKVYTPEHEAKLKADREKRAVAKQNARHQDFIEHIGDKLKDMGFGCENGVYVLYRVVGNTYSVKDKLKAAGCKFNPTVGWFGADFVDGYECQRMLAVDVVTKDDKTCMITWKSKDEVAPLFSERQKAVEESPSRYQGEIGDRLDIEVSIDRVFDSHFSHGYYDTTSYLYVMHDSNGNIFTWSTAKCYEVGKTYQFKATVKDHIEYTNKMGVKIQQTVITRCKLLDAK